MTRAKWYENHRLARIGNLGTLACTTRQEDYRLFFAVYCSRYPHIGSDRHFCGQRNATECLTRAVSRLHAKLVEFHNKRGWYHISHKSLNRLWSEYRAICPQGKI